MQDQPRSGFYKEIDLPTEFAMASPGLFAMNDTPIMALEYHDILELGHCHQGNGVFVVGNKVLPFTAGDVSIISPGELHLAQSHRGTTSSWTFVFLDVEELLLPHFSELAGFDIHAYSGPDFSNVVSPRDKPEITSIVCALIRESKYRRPRYKTMILSQLSMLAVLLERQFTGTSTRHTNSASRTSIAPVKKALEYIAQRYYEPLEIGTLARMCNMSLRNFARRFSEALKRSPHEYIVDTRMAVACSHLLRRDAPVSYVAEQAGFRSISAFNRTFKHKMGMSPREWRKRRGEEELAVTSAPVFPRTADQNRSTAEREAPSPSDGTESARRRSTLAPVR